jgi:hypothetical protein
MKEEFGVGAPVYYVPECDRALAQYVPVTSVHSSLKRPLLTLGRQLVITPKLRRNGMLARDRGGSYWVSKEAFEAQPSAGNARGLAPAGSSVPDEGDYSWMPAFFLSRRNRSLRKKRRVFMTQSATVR